MKITFLGTGTSQGVPVIACDCLVCKSKNQKDKRLRVSVMVEVDDKNFVIDTGPDFRQQMLREKVEQLDAVIFTHAHKDHIAGLDDVRAFNFTKKNNFEPKAMDVYADDFVQKALKREFVYAFDGSDYPGIPKITLQTIDKKPFKIFNTVFTPIQVFHYKLPVLGFRIKDFTYITDANFIPEEEKKKIYGSKVLVLNAVRKEIHISHFNLEQAIEQFEELKSEKCFITHISHQMGLHEEVNKTLPHNIQLAYDGLKIEL